MVAPIRGIPMPNKLVSIEEEQRLAALPEFKKKIAKKSKSTKGQSKEKEDTGAEDRSNLLNMTTSVHSIRKI